MSLPACFIRESVKDAKGGRPQADGEPSRSGRLILHYWKATQEKALYLFLFPGFGFQTNEQRYLDHYVPPVVTPTPSCAILSSKPNAIFTDLPASSSVAG
ncbi:hypothetical protein D9M71_739020 [compost metagenome]